ncbi:MAG: MurR/RpiR family transcriptional regulator [Clostridium celatum]|nr:MurR/RpiR family transcriptional regulator [Clostridium celatum]
MQIDLNIKENYDSLTKSEKKIAMYIIENPKIAIKNSVQEIGEITGTSPASVIRFSKKIGYDSLSDLKIDLASLDSNTNKEEIDHIIDESDNMIEVLEKVNYKVEEGNKNTISLVNGEMLEEAVRLIKSADTIYIFAIGASGLAAMDFQHKMLRVKKKIIYNLDSAVQLISAMNITPKDIAIGISYSGNTKSVNKSMSEAKENGAKTIAITTSGNNNLSEISDIVINIPKVERDIRLGAISSRNSQFLITDTLFLGCVKDNFEETEEQLIKTRKMTYDLSKEK